jgi:hypothetical protein
MAYLAHPISCSVNSKGLNQSITNFGFVQMIWIIVLEELEKNMQLITTCAYNMAYATSDRIDLIWGHNLGGYIISFMWSAEMCPLDYFWDW